MAFHIFSISIVEWISINKWIFQAPLEQSSDSPVSCVHPWDPSQLSVHETYRIAVFTREKWSNWYKIIVSCNSSRKRGGFITCDLTSPFWAILPRLTQRFLHVPERSPTNCFEKKHSHRRHMNRSSCAIPCAIACFPWEVDWRRSEWVDTLPDDFSPPPPMYVCIMR